jgi:hypothetical protein
MYVGSGRDLRDYFLTVPPCDNKDDAGAGLPNLRFLSTVIATLTAEDCVSEYYQFSAVDSKREFGSTVSRPQSCRGWAGGPSVV